MINAPLLAAFGDGEQRTTPRRRAQHTCNNVWPKMLVIGHIALAAWTPGHAAPSYAASRSRPVIAAAEVSVTAAMDRRDDESSSASLPPSFPLTAHGLRTGPCSFSLAILALATSARPPSRGASTCGVFGVREDAPAHPTRSPRAGPTPKAGGETVDDEEDGMEKYGKDPRPLLTSGEPAAGWVVPAKGSLGQITSVPELDAALAAAEERSKVVVVKFFAPWCTSCKVRQLLA